MKGLKEYIKVHGKHFTEELAHKVGGKKWSSKQVEQSAQRKVYFNVTGATLGDMTYLANMVYFHTGWSKGRCIDFCLSVIGDFKDGKGYAFKHFMESSHSFDLTPYI